MALYVPYVGEIVSRTGPKLVSVNLLRMLLRFIIFLGVYFGSVQRKSTCCKGEIQVPFLRFSDDRDLASSVGFTGCRIWMILSVFHLSGVWSVVNDILRNFMGNDIPFGSSFFFPL